MKSKTRLQKKLLVILGTKSKPKNSIKLFCSRNNLSHTQNIENYKGKNNLLYWKRKTLIVSIEDNICIFEYVGIFFPRWRVA